MTAQVIAQVEGEFRAWGYGMTLSKKIPSIGMLLLACLARSLSFADKRV